MDVQRMYGSSALLPPSNFAVFLLAGISLKITSSAKHFVDY